MTESEAYEILEWPKAGNPLFFVLPISDSTRTDWIVTTCPCDCGYRGLTIPEAKEDPHHMSKCPRCDVPWLEQS